MDQITYIEDAIITRLKEIPLQAGVLPYPDRNFEDYEPLHTNGEILVVYSDETDGPSRDAGAVIQDREIFFEFTFVFSSLRSVGKAGGLYAHLEAVRIGMTGFKPEVCTKKTVLDSVERVKRYKKRWWQYTQTWKFTALNIEVPEEEQGALLNRLTVIDDVTNDSLEVP